MAPAITLNRMYHCVPSSSKMIEPIPSPPPTRIKHQQNNREQRGRRNRRRHLRDGLRDSRKLGIQADRDSHRNGPQPGEEQE